jgi:hypothetical protein
VKIGTSTLVLTVSEMVKTSLGGALQERYPLGKYSMMKEILYSFLHFDGLRTNPFAEIVLIAQQDLTKHISLHQPIYVGK